MKKTLYLLAAAIIIALASVSCDSELTGHEIVGKWEHAGDVFEFCDDGRLIYGGSVYTYTVDGSEVTIDRGGNALRFDYSLNPDGTLVLGDLVYYPVGQKLKSSDESSSSMTSLREKSIAET